LSSIIKAIKQTRTLRRVFKVSSFVLGGVALSPVIFEYLSYAMFNDLQDLSAAYLTNMGYLVMDILSLAFVFVAMDYALKARVRDLEEIERSTDDSNVVSALTVTFVRNIRRNAVILYVVAFIFSFIALQVI
jgi:hypothetical protein